MRSLTPGTRPPKLFLPSCCSTITFFVTWGFPFQVMTSGVLSWNPNFFKSFAQIYVKLTNTFFNKIFKDLFCPSCWAIGKQETGNQVFIDINEICPRYFPFLTN
jgi:hypothetical protein